MFRVPEELRVKAGIFSTSTSDGNNGLFLCRFNNEKLAVIASDGEGWNHVSVSCENRMPTWEEMCFIKNLFFGGDGVAIQVHPMKKDYVNKCVNCLHLWEHQGYFPLPPKHMV